MMTDKIKYGIQPISPQAATGHLKQAYAQMSHDLTGVHEPFLIHSPSEEILLGLWSSYRESLLARGRVSRALKETITVAVSQINQCPWCFDAHQISLYAVGAGKTVTAISKPNKPTRLDDQTTAILEWARATRTPGASILQDPPFSPAAAPEIIGTALIYHYLTRVVNVLLVENAFPDTIPSQPWLRTLFKQIFGLIFAPYARQVIPQGETLSFLPETPLPADFAWAQPSPNIAGAFSRFAAAVENAGKHSVPAPVRQIVQDYLYSWNGEDPGMSRGWVERIIQPLDAEMEPQAKLILLGAVAPHHVDEDVIAAFRNVLPNDEQLIESLAWGSLAAARRIGSWLYPSKWRDSVARKNEQQIVG
jgi:AhpD family alkylhydroperoxidase